ncbi:hypothetical protein AOXY_G6339 [Acipenser oxyrinchus oxyrinchus]|uniref:Uncharacterized protein n=1 Tax=Acipenser oxyrinchus oxyrinchus TaxID=40147 RepID=A0AAD8GBU8_ACIOX|nr:hypothetical protein AOXY_G6339 [Acipenser oxyrinchus oxyrinchus]
MFLLFLSLSDIRCFPDWLHGAISGIPGKEGGGQAVRGKGSWELSPEYKKERGCRCTAEGTQNHFSGTAA